MKRILMLGVYLAFLWASANAPGQAAAAQGPLTVFDLIEQGRLELAISLLEKDLRTANRSDTQRARSYSLLGYAYKEEGRFELAQHSFDQALQLMEATGDHSSDYAATLDFYAGTLMATGDFGSAATVLSKAVRVDTRLGNHVGLSLIYSHIAEVDIGRKDFKHAKKAVVSARAEAVLSKGHGAISEIDTTIGWLAVATGKFHDGVIAYEAALDESRHQFGDDSPVTGWTYILLGDAQEFDHDLTAAETNFVKGLAILKRSVGSDNIQYLFGEVAYSDVLERTGSSAEATRIRTSAQQSIRSQGMEKCAACTVSVFALRRERDR